MQIIPGPLAAELRDRYTVYSRAQIRAAWQAVTDYAHIDLILKDDNYRALAEADWQKVMAASDTRTLKYTPDYSDCDYFALLFCAEVQSLLVNGCGWMLDWSGEHSFNLVVVGGGAEPKFKWVEPQGDSWIIPNSAKCYNLKGRGLVIL